MGEVSMVVTAWMLALAGACGDAIGRLGNLSPEKALAEAGHSDLEWARGYGYGYGNGNGNGNGNGAILAIHCEGVRYDHAAAKAWVSDFAQRR